jgi:hypothetical protein
MLPSLGALKHPSPDPVVELDESFELIGMDDPDSTGVLPGLPGQSKKEVRENNAAIRKFTDRLRMANKKAARQEKSEANKLAKKAAAQENAEARAEVRAQKKRDKLDAAQADENLRKAAFEARAAADKAKMKTVKAEDVMDELLTQFLVVLEDLSININMSKEEQEMAVQEESRKLEAVVQERQSSVEAIELEMRAIEQQAASMKNAYKERRAELTEEEKKAVNSRYQDAKMRLATATAAQVEADANYDNRAKHILLVRKDLAIQTLYTRNSRLNPLVTGYDLYKEEKTREYVAKGLPTKGGKAAGKAPAASRWQRGFWNAESAEMKKAFEARAGRLNEAQMSTAQRKELMEWSEHAWNAILFHYGIPLPRITDVTQRKTLSIVVLYDRPGGVAVAVDDDVKTDSSFLDMMSDVFEGASKSSAAKGNLLKRWNHNPSGADLVLKGIALEIACYRMDSKYEEFSIEFPAAYELMEDAGPSDAGPSDAGPSDAGPSDGQKAVRGGADAANDTDGEGEYGSEGDRDADADVTAEVLFGSGSDDDF